MVFTAHAELCCSPAWAAARRCVRVSIEARFPVLLFPFCVVECLFFSPFAHICYLHFIMLYYQLLPLLFCFKVCGYKVTDVCCFFLFSVNCVLTASATPTTAPGAKRTRHARDASGSCSSKALNAGLSLVTRVPCVQTNLQRSGNISSKLRAKGKINE